MGHNPNFDDPLCGFLITEDGKKIGTEDGIPLVTECFALQILQNVSGLYDNFVSIYNSDNIDLINDDIVIVPISDDYRMDLTEINLDHVSEFIVGPEVSLGPRRELVGDTFKETDRIYYWALTNVEVGAFIMYKKTTGELIGFFKDDFKGTVKFIIHGDISWRPNPTGFFSVDKPLLYRGRVTSYTRPRTLVKKKLPTRR